MLDSRMKILSTQGKIELKTLSDRSQIVRLFTNCGRLDSGITQDKYMYSSTKELSL